MRSDSEFDLDGVIDRLRATVVRPHMGIDEARQEQFALVDALQQEMGSDVALEEDSGQARDLATVGFGGGGRPHATDRVERALTRYFDVDQAVLVHGAGTGAIRAMLNAALAPGSDVVVHSAHPYKTTTPSMEHMGLRIRQVDFNDLAELEADLAAAIPSGLYLQHVPQQIGDDHQIDHVIEIGRRVGGEAVRILVDDNYAMFRSRRTGTHMGADASAFSLFKLQAPSPVGCVIGSAEIVDRIRIANSSAGIQVQGRDAMEAIRSLVHVPVALAIQNEVVEETAQRIDEAITAGRHPYLRAAIAAQPGIRCVVLVFDRPVAEEFVRSAWRNGSPSRSVGEEARHEFLPLFTYITSTFLKGTPGLERYAIRINPMRSGPDTILRIFERSLADEQFQARAA